MTALVAVQAQPELGRVVTIKPEWTGAEGSSLYLSAGEQITMEALLYGLLLHSGNDAAVALALAHSGSVGAFVEAMNGRARELGLQDTHFTNPNGLDAPEHYSTALDLARLTQEVALYSDRINIDEEIARMRSHVGAMRDALKSADPVGRQMDFIVQEMNREANTMGSKASDIELTSCVVNLKSEIEKIREQVQNIE